MVTVPHAPASAGEARRELGADLARLGVPETVVCDAKLLVSELVGNSVRHARALPGGVLTIAWKLEAKCLRLRVSDGGGAQRPRLHAAAPADQRGRGLAIVAALARDWGVEVHQNGAGRVSTVWADLALG